MPRIYKIFPQSCQKRKMTQNKLTKGTSRQFTKEILMSDKEIDAQGI